MTVFSSLKYQSLTWVLSALLIGAIATSLWAYSTIAWERHRDRAYFAGTNLYQNLYHNLSAQNEVTISRLSGKDARLAEAGLFTKLPDILPSDYITQLSLQGATASNMAQPQIKVAIAAAELRYPIAKLENPIMQSSQEKLGELARLLASYCAEPAVFISPNLGVWYKINGDEIWGCDAMPADFRLPAILFIVLGLMTLSTVIFSTSNAFNDFAIALKYRGVQIRPQTYKSQGPKELTLIIDSINTYVEKQRASLSKRAMFLSSISHDLGTPATRLRLRAESITDKDLKRKINEDINQMNLMISSILDYTQTEINAEPPKNISLVSLIESIVADYQDSGQPVKFLPLVTPKIKSNTIFSDLGQKKQTSHVLRPTQIVIFAQPIALQRAISNLVDNALKYGRKAAISLSSTSVNVVIHVDDYGTEVKAEEFQNLTSPFARGNNTMNVSGSGLGLAITATVIEQHGGTLEFTNWEHGLRATLTIPR